jgi:hypothetical protein
MLIEPTIPEKPQNCLQNYRLTSAGKKARRKNQSQKMILLSMILPNKRFRPANHKETIIQNQAA